MVLSSNAGRIQFQRILRIFTNTSLYLISYLLTYITYFTYFLLTLLTYLLNYFSSFTYLLITYFAYLLYLLYILTYLFTFLFSILDISKLIMYQFYYDYLKPKYGDKCTLLFTDTDYFCCHIQTEDLY